MNWETLMCFGDSITIGARSYCGYPEYAGHFLEESAGSKWNIINHAVSRYTAMDLARLITSHFHNLKPFEPGVITIMIGTNDVKINTSPGDFEIAYKQVLLKSLLLTSNRNVALIKLPFFPKNVSYPYLFKMNAIVHQFNNIITEIAAKNDLRTIEFQLTEGDLYDGVHLSSAGAKNAGQQLAGFIESDKGFDNKLPEAILITRPEHV